MWWWCIYQDSKVTLSITGKINGDSPPTVITHNPIGLHNVFRYVDATVAADRNLPVADVHRLTRSEEHTSELQSRENLVCRLLLEKKNNNISTDRDVHTHYQ